MKSTSCFRLFVVLLCSCWASLLLAQTTTQDVVYLKNGSIIRGEVVEYQAEGKIKIEIAGGSLLVYDSSEVVKMEKETINAPRTTNNRPNPVRPKPEERHLMDKGYYVMMGLTSIGAELPPSIPLPGIGGDVAAGWRLNPHLLVGAGTSLHVALAQSFWQTYGHVRFNFLSKTSFTPYLDGQVGYGLLLSPNAIMNGNNFGWMDGIQSIDFARGGFYARPAVGVRFASRNAVHCFLDIGCTFQDSYYEGRTWNQLVFIERRLLQRVSIRVGMVF